MNERVPRQVATAMRQFDAKRRRHRLALRAGGLLCVAAVALVVATTQLARGAAEATPHCSHLFVPAFFYPGPEWQVMDGGKYVPKDIILDISGVGAGSAPEQAFANAVKSAQARGITVLGYSSTEYTDRPLSEVEADVKHYKSWYHVKGVFLDEGSATSKDLPYYEQLTQFIHKLTPKAPIWLNVGAYPVQGYMNVANVVMTFEGSYESYLNEATAPSWIHLYDPRRFSNVVYETPGAHWKRVEQLSHLRHVGYTYITDGSGGNPYSSLPSYWKAEVTADHGCRN